MPGAHDGCPLSRWLRGRCLAESLNLAEHAPRGLVAGAIPSRFEGTAAGLLGIEDYRLTLGEPEVRFEPSVTRPTLRLDGRGSVKVGGSTYAAVLLADLQALVVPVQAPRLVSKGKKQTTDGVGQRPPGEVRIGFDLRSALFTRFELTLDGKAADEVVSFSGAVKAVRDIVQGKLRAIPPEQFLFTPPLLDQIRAAGYEVRSPKVRLREDAVVLGFDVKRKNSKGEVLLETKGDPNQLVDLSRAELIGGFRKVYMQHLPTGSDEFGRPLTEAGYSASVRPLVAAPHPAGATIALNAALLLDLYDSLGRFLILEGFEKDKAAKAQNTIQRLRATDRTDAWTALGASSSPTGKDRKFELGNGEKVVFHHAKLELKDGELVIDGNVTFLGDMALNTNVKIALRVTRISVSGSTAFVVKHTKKDNPTAKEGLHVELVSVQIGTPEAVTIMQVLGFAVGVALAPVTAGASLAIATMGVLIADATVTSLIGNAERQAHKALAGTAASGFGLPLDWTHVTLVPDAPVVLDIRPNDVVIDKLGVLTWFEVRAQLATAQLRLADASSSNPWPSSKREPIGLMLEGAETLSHPDDSAVEITWTLTAVGASLEPLVPIVRKGPLCPTRGVDAAAMRYAIDHQSDTLRPYDRFVVTCRVSRPTETGSQTLYEGTYAISIQDRLLRHKPYVRWRHIVFYDGFSRKVGDPFRAPTGGVKIDRKSAIHLTDPAMRCKMADRYSKDLTPTSLEYLDALPFPKAELNAHRAEVCEYCFFGNPQSSTPRPGV